MARRVASTAADPEKLGLLLTSGASKGSPLVAVVRAGCANAVVCDERAARAALERLGALRATGRRAKSGRRQRPDRAPAPGEAPRGPRAGPL
jgi:hypothetical protein